MSATTRSLLKLDQAYNRVQSRGVGGTSTALERERELYNSDSPCAFRSPQGGVLCTHCARRINLDAHHRLKIPLWNLEREQQISRHVIRMVPHINSYMYVWYMYSQDLNGARKTPWISPHLPHDFHRFRFPTAPYRHALYAWVPGCPPRHVSRVRCRKAFVTYLRYLYKMFALAGPLVALPTVSSHGEVTAA